jgi:hypothetical protein
MVDLQYKVILREPANARFIEQMENKVILSEAGIEYLHIVENDMLLIIGTDELGITELCSFLAQYLEPITNIGLVTQITTWEPEWHTIH